MQRRRFILAACALAATSVTPAITLAASSGSRRLAEFGFRVGDRFRGDQGCVFEVAEVSSPHTHAHCQQCDVHFRQLKGPKLAEGIYRLEGTTVTTELFLQPSTDGARALLSRLI